MNYHLKKVFIILLVFYLSIYAQTPMGKVSIPIIYLPGDTIRGTSSPLQNNEFGFEIWLVNSDSIPYAYNAGQYGVNINPKISNEGTLTVEIISSQLISSTKQPKLSKFIASPDRIRLAANRFGDGGPFIQAGDSINIAVVKVTSTNEFKSIDCDIFSDLELRTKNPDAVAVFVYADDGMKSNTGKAVMLNISRITYKRCKSN